MAIFKKITISLILCLIAFIGNTSNTNADSIVSVICNAQEGANMKAINTVVDAKILALNNWANNTTWNNPDEVRMVSEKIIDYAILHKNDSLLSWAYHYQALAYYYMSYWNHSIDIYKKALSTYWAQKSPTAKSFRAFCNLNIGCNHENLGNFDKAVEFYYTSIRMNEELNLPYVVAEAKLDVASVNIHMNNLNEATTNLQEAIPVLQEFRDSVRISESYRMLSKIKALENLFPQAESYFIKARDIALSLNDNERLVKIYLDYGDILYKQGQINESYNIYNKAVGYCNPDQFPASFYLINGKMGSIYLHKKQYARAENTLVKAYAGLKKLEATAHLPELSQNLARLYAEMGNNKKFQHYFSLSLALKDSLAAIEKLRSIAESEVIHQSAKKDQQIVLQKLELKNKTTQIIFMSLLLFILLIGFIITLRLLRKILSKNKYLLERNIELSKKWNELQASLQKTGNKPSKPSLFNRIYQIIAEKEEYANPQLSVDYLARELNTNTKYISKAIRDKTGMNFNTFVNTFRIEKAKSILSSHESDKWPLEVIAEKCGFNNHTTFYQSFKQKTGLTPSLYRRMSA